MNKCFLIGNLTKDPEHSTTPSNIKVCRFTVAVNRSYSSAEGTRQTDFLPIVCWRSQAENCAKFLRKGSKVGLCGSVQTRTYDANDGTKRYVTEIVADEVQFLSSKQDDGFDDGVQDLPEVKNSKARIEELKPIDDGDLPF
jgi:single-strand DNA-binding protein